MWLFFICIGVIRCIVGFWKEKRIRWRKLLVDCKKEFYGYCYVYRGLWRVWKEEKLLIEVSVGVRGYL